MSRPSYVYFIWDSEYIKIGASNNPLSRLANLQTANARRLILLLATPGGPALELYLHDRFAYIGVGGEWYKDNHELRWVISVLREGVDILHNEPATPPELLLSVQKWFDENVVKCTLRDAWSVGRLQEHYLTWCTQNQQSCICPLLFSRFLWPQLNKQHLGVAAPK